MSQPENSTCHKDVILTPSSDNSHISPPEITVQNRVDRLQTAPDSIKPEKIVMINNFLTHHGGTEVIVETLYNSFRAMGLNVYLFGMDCKPYFEETLPYQDYFPAYTDFDSFASAKKPLSLAELVKAVKAVIGIFYNQQAKSSLDKLLDEIRPDWVYIHGFVWHLSASILHSCTRRGLPVIHHVHDARLFCPAGTLMKGGKTNCETVLCANHHAGYAIFNRCYNNSMAKSMLVAAEFELKRFFTVYRDIHQFIVPSQALKTHMQTMNIPAEKITVLPNPVDMPEQPPVTRQGRYFLYVGRLSPEKGLDVLLAAMALLPRDIPLHIVGKGSLEAEYKAYAEEHQLSRVQFLGWKNAEDLPACYQDSIATIVPSCGFEAFGNVVQESFKAGRPVVASRMGGLPERVNENKTGFLVEPGNPKHLAEKLLMLWDNPELAILMGNQALENSRRFMSSTHFAQEVLKVMRFVHQPAEA
jgi:glycosyltransferase involved in cell wall biosynthesis